MKFRLVALWVLYAFSALAVDNQDNECSDNNRGIGSLGCCVKDGKILPFRCVSGAQVTTLIGESEARFFNTYANTEDEQNFGYSLSAHGEALFGLVSAGFETAFDSKKEKRDLDLSYHFSFVTKPIVVHLSQPTRLESADCGDGFVSGVTLGARFELIATLRFYDQQTFEKFDSKFDVSALFGALEVGGNISKEMQELTAHSDIFIDVIQVGSDRSMLDQISLSEDAVQCRLNRSIGNCFMLFQRYNKYFKDDFVPSLKSAEFQPIDLRIEPYHGLKGVNDEI